MSGHDISMHLDGTEQVRTFAGTSIDAIYVGVSPYEFGFVFPHNLPATTRIRILRELAEAASDLADEINLRDLESVSA